MIRQDTISSAAGSRRPRKRVGRGTGSGHGTYSGRGIKGQKARAGSSDKRGFEGGQLPLVKRLPRKRGFYNAFARDYVIVNVGTLAGVSQAGDEVTREKLVAAGVIRNGRLPLKVLASGEINHAITVKADKFSVAARAKIEAAGGKAEEVGDAGSAD